MGDDRDDIDTRPSDAAVAVEDTAQASRPDNRDPGSGQANSKSSNPAAGAQREPRYAVVEDLDPSVSEAEMGLVGKARGALLAPVMLLLRTIWRMIPRFFKESWLTRTTVETVALVRRNRVMGIAAEVGFWAVLSITPLLLVSASALGWIDSLFGLEVADDAHEGITTAVRDLLGIGGNAVTAVDELFDNPDPSSLTVGLLTSIYASSRGFTSLIGGLDHIIGREQRRNWLTTRVAGFSAAVLTVPALVALLVMVSIGRTGFGLPAPWSGIAAYATWPLISLGLTGFAVWLLHASPAQRTPILHDIPGAVVAVAIWLGGSWITARYLASGGSDVLGILGGATGLLIWLYLMAAGILIGAQVNVAIFGTPEGSAQAPAS